MNYKDTWRTFQDAFLTKTNETIWSKTYLRKYLETFNPIDEYQWACSLANYLRYVLRFTSAYVSIFKRNNILCFAYITK